jgi:mono/diheme cytochrome c family protein
MRKYSLIAVFGVVVAGCLGDIHGEGIGGSGPRAGGTPSAEPTTPQSTRPVFGPTVAQDDPPPPISGGTLGVSPDGSIAVVADPDRDRIYVVKLADFSFREIPLELHDEPGRVTFDGKGRAHVALRRGGAVVSIDLATGTVPSRRPVCGAPRGIAYDWYREALVVACATGELVTIPDDGALPTSVFIEDDLRDVLVRPSGVTLTTFRSAELITVDAEDGSLRRDVRDHGHVAWRATTAPSGESVVVSIASPTTTAATPPVYYGSFEPCAPTGPTTFLSFEGWRVPYRFPAAVLAVDLAVSNDWFAFAAAGNAFTPNAPAILLASRNRPPPAALTTGCDPGLGIHVEGQVTSVAFTPNGGRLLAFSREPAVLYVLSGQNFSSRDARIEFPVVSRADTGHAIFHANAGRGSACASCHAEGRDDGYTWRSMSAGARRTPSLAGLLANTAPYHWNGEAADLPAVARMTFSDRMQGPPLVDRQLSVLSRWLLALPALPARPALDAAAAARGQAQFAERCAGCHSGSVFTSNASVDVGTGGTWQIPSLVGVAHHAPYFHDGSAGNLDAVIGTHPSTTPATATERADLRAYLETL